MINEFSIITPTLEHKQKAIEYKQEHFDNGEGMLKGSSWFHNYEIYEEWLNFIESLKNGKEPEYPPITTYFGICNSNIVGMINIKHKLTENWRENINYGVRPSERRKGYATEMLTLALNECRKVGLKRVSLSINKKNTGSAKAIIKNGGILESEYVEEDNGEIGQWYWIDVK